MRRFDFEQMKRSITELVIRATQLIQIGERARAKAFFAQHEYDLENRLALVDAFTSRVLGPQQAETHTEIVSD